MIDRRLEMLEGDGHFGNWRTRHMHTLWVTCQDMVPFVRPKVDIQAYKWVLSWYDDNRYGEMEFGTYAELFAYIERFMIDKRYEVVFSHVLDSLCCVKVVYDGHVVYVTCWSTSRDELRASYMWNVHVYDLHSTLVEWETQFSAYSHAEQWLKRKGYI